MQVSALTVRITSLSEKAQSAVKAKNRVGALAALKSKRAAETTLSPRYETLEQVEGVYGKIEQAADQVAVVRIMEASTGVLQSLHSQVGGVEKVEDIVESLKDEMTKVGEIGQVMEEVGREDAVDEDVIDEELEALERQDRTEREEQEAEKTRKRLAEIDAIKQREAPKVPSVERPENPTSSEDTNFQRRSSLEEQPSEKGAETPNKVADAIAAGD